MRINRKIKYKCNIYTLACILSIAVMMYYFLPIVTGVISASMMMIILGVLYCIIFLFSKWQLRKVFLFNGLLIISLIILFFVRDYYKRGIIGIYAVFLLFAPAFVTVFFYYKKEYLYLKILAVVSLMSLFVTSITTYSGLSIYPNLARILATISESDSQILQLSIGMNIGGFDLVYSAILCMPIYIILIDRIVKNTILNKGIKVMICILEFLLAIKTQYTTAMLLVIFGTILIVCLKKFNIIRICILGVLLYLLLSNSTDKIVVVLNQTADRLDDSAIATRMLELSSSLEGGEASGEDISARSDAYMKSIEEFLNNPITGIWYKEGYQSVGGHSTFLDLLAAGGIVAFICIIYTIASIIRSLVFPLYEEKEKKYIGIFFMNYIILAFLNPLVSGTFFAVLFIIPVGITCEQKILKSYIKKDEI